MQITLFQCVTVPFCVAVILVSYLAAFCVACRSCPSKPLAERLLLAALGSVLATNAEMYLFSWIPGSRPLDWLPLAHLLSLGILIAAGWRRAGSRFVTGPVRELHSRVRDVLDHAPVPVRLASVFTAGLLLVIALFGSYFNFVAWDEMGYHVPQAVQPYQDGRVADLDSFLPWTYGYPKGAALVWGWTMFWTHSDLLFRPLQLALGLTFLCAVYVLARRLGASPHPALAVVLAMAWMPIFFRVTTICGSDIGFSAGCVASLAFLVRAGEDPDPTGSLLGALLGLAQACLVKLPILEAFFFGFGSLLLILELLRRKRLGATLRTVRYRTLACGAVVVLLGCHTYVGNLIAYRNPIYPMNVAIAGHQVVSGPMRLIRPGAGLNTTMAHLSRTSPVQMYYAAWTDWYGMLNEDSMGTVGPSLLVGVFGLFVAGTFLAFRQRDWTLVGIAVLLGIALLIPGSYLPRYGLPVTALIFAGAAVFVSSLPLLHRNALIAMVLAVAALGLNAVWLEAKATVLWGRENNGGVLLSTRRTLALSERRRLGTPEYASPQTTQFIRSHCGAGCRLAWNVHTFQTWLWNTDYSNKTVYVAGTADDRAPDGFQHLPLPSKPELDAWCRRIRALQPDFVLVYARSAYAAALRDSRDAGAFTTAMQDGAERGDMAMTMFARVADR
jgi:hypothetical protein